jgi:hypothetical protein
MPNFIFKSPLVISGSTGVESSLVGETQAVTSSPIEFSIGQGVGTTDDVEFNIVSGSTSFTVGTDAQNIVLAYQSISGSTILLDGEEFNITENLITENDLTITGKISAQKIESALSQSITIESSGSTKFGDDVGDKHTVTGSMSITGSLKLNGYTVNEISNDGALNDNRSDSVLTEYAGKYFFQDIINKSGYLRKKFAKVANSITSTTASFTAVSASAPEGLSATIEDDFMFFNNGMIIEYDALKVMQKGSTFELHIDNSSLGYSLDGDDEIVAWGKFNS